MNAVARTAAIAWISVLLLATQAGCATRAPDFNGRWQPVNHYAATTQVIALHRSYVYQAAPMDGTLKTMLTRWARDSGLQLAYLHPSDFTLHAPVGQINTYYLQQAAEQLSSIYAGQDVLVTVDGDRVTVRLARDAGTQVPAAGADAAATIP